MQLICDYITSNEIDFNIKESIKEGKIKVLISYPNFIIVNFLVI